MENLNLLRAKFAIEKIESYKSKDSFIKSIAALIHNNGLLATLQFDVNKEKNKIFCTLFRTWIIEFKVKSNLFKTINTDTNENFIRSIANITNVYEYQLLTDEAMNLFIWLKRSLSND